MAKTPSERIADLLRGSQSFIAVIKALEIQDNMANIDATNLVRQATNQLAAAIINESMS